MAIASEFEALAKGHRYEEVHFAGRNPAAVMEELVGERDQGPEHLVLVAELFLSRLAALSEIQIPRRWFEVAHRTKGSRMADRSGRQPVPLTRQEPRSRRIASRAAASACACSSAVGGLGSGT
jgi:hypothetical protein